MKNFLICVTALTLLLTGLTGKAYALDLTQWKFQSEVTIENNIQEYCKLTLTPAIYNASQPDLADIRIIDPNSLQIPYVLAKPSDVTKQSSFTPEILNRSTNAAGATMLTLDFGNMTIKNHIAIRTQGDNFRRAMKIEGSNDNIEFFTIIDEAFIFAVNSNTRFEQVNMPSNDFRYLRISISPMPTEETGPVIDSVWTYNIQTNLAERQQVDMELLDKSEDEQERSSIYTYDLGYQNLPITEIQLETDDDSFYRYVTVEGRNAATRKVKIHSEDNRERFKDVEVPWERIANGTIYRYLASNTQKQEGLLLHISSNKQLPRYIRLKVNNYDDTPITIKSSSAKMISHQIIFENQHGSSQMLYTGSKQVNKPRYDLENTLNEPLRVQAGIAVLGDVINNSQFSQDGQKPIAWTEKYQYLLLIALVTMGLVLGVFIVKSLKTIRLDQTP